MDVIITALIVSVLAPILLAFLTNRAQAQGRKEEAEQRRLDKHEDWKRQDEVAKKAAEDSQRMERYNEKLTSNSEKLDDIHQLVNGNLTIMMRQALDAHLAQLAWMREAKTLSGEIRSVETINAIRALEEEIRVLQNKLSDRTMRQLSE